MIPRVRMARKRLAIARERARVTEDRWVESLWPPDWEHQLTIDRLFSKHLRAAKLLRAISNRKDPIA